MRSHRRPGLPIRRSHLALALLAFSWQLGNACNSPKHEAVGSQTFASPQGQPIVLSPDGARVFVAVTTANTVEVLDAATHQSLATVRVGLEPVSLAVRADGTTWGTELWVSNHVSDSVSVVDIAPGSATQYQVIETIQLQDADGVTLFDEPVGIAFANGDTKAYVALSSRDQIAVIDATSYSVSPTTIDVNAQDPRAMRVRDGRLYVLPFESGNQSELSSCPNPPFPTSAQCTFDQNDFNFATQPQLIGAAVDIVIDPDVPDRDLYVYDTSDDSLVQVVSGIGTLLYGLAVDGSGRVFVSMTDARNAENGQAGTAGQILDDLDNRMFLNQLGRVDCGGGGPNPCGGPTDIDLEEAPGQPVTTPLATPYGIEISDDDSTLVVTAAASSRIFTFDTSSTGMGGILDTLDVGAIPRGVALRSDGSGAPETAWVLNSLDGTVTVVDVSNPSSLSKITDIPLVADGIPPAVKAGRIAFNDANGSSSGTFACASCHPDGNTDQLLWVIGAACSFNGCDQQEVRSTMPVRGLRDTVPLHWDGTLGDPLGGTNGETQTGIFQGPSNPANCGPDAGGLNCFRQLSDASLSGVMCDQSGGCATGPSGLPGPMTSQQRDDMAAFLENVSYPPARSRRGDDSLSASALAGFEDFFMDQGGQGGFAPETCGDPAGGCHALPFGAGSNSGFVGGFDAPTLRGITDRWLQFSAGVTNIEENLVLTSSVDLIDGPPWTPAIGFDEFIVWKLAFGSATSPGAFRQVYNVGPFDIFQMLEEASTGYSGAVGRQVTLNAQTAGPGEIAQTEAILDELELSDARGLVNLRGVGLRNGNPIVFTYIAALDKYRRNNLKLSRAELLAEAAAGTTLLTMTAELRANVGKAGFEPPALAVPSVGSPLTDGRPDLPVLPGTMAVRGLHIRDNSTLLVDGELVTGTIVCTTGGFAPHCPADVTNPNQLNLFITLDVTPPNGTHLLQVVSPKGPVSNELPFLVQ